MSKIILLIVNFGFFNSVFSQSETSDSNKIYSDSVLLIVATNECDIVFADGRVLENVRISGLKDTMFSITRGVNVNRSFQIAGIKEITFRKHGFWQGVLYGYLGTAALGGIMGLTTKGGGHPNFGGGFVFVVSLLLGIPVAIVTGIIAEVATDNDVYNFPGNNTEAKVKRLKYIISEQKDN